MRIAFDTNLLVYAEGASDRRRRDIAVDLIARLPEQAVVIPCQVLGELFNVLCRKNGWTREEACGVLLNWCDQYPVAPTTPEALLAAADLAKDHGLQIWDALILTVSARSGCRFLLSEDMQDGFTWGGVTVINPFSTTPNPLLRALLSD